MLTNKDNLPVLRRFRTKKYDQLDMGRWTLDMARPEASPKNVYHVSSGIGRQRPK